LEIDVLKISQLKTSMIIQNSINLSIYFKYYYILILFMLHYCFQSKD